jgi:predicted ester cyclase
MTSSEQNSAAARGIFETLEHGNLDALDAIISPDYVLHDPSMPDEVRGVEGAKEMIETYRSAFGLRVTIEHQFADGDYVATRYTAHGTHDSELLGVPPTGREVTAAGICISRCLHGKVVEEWDLWDTLGVLQQISAPTTVES